VSVSTLIPSADLAPSVTSRVLLVRAVDFTEGAPATGSITFELPWDVDVKADGVILKAGKQTLDFDENGELRIRVPTSDPDTNPDAWFLVVKKSWAPHPYAIRVPVGTTVINLVDVPIVEELPASAAPGFFLTGASASVTTGGPASVTTEVAGGIANFDFVLPATGWVRGNLTTGADLNTMTVPGVYRLSGATGVTNLPPVTGAGNVSGFLTITNGEGSGTTWAHQEFVRYGNAYEKWRRMSTNTSGSWSPWVRSSGSDVLVIASNQDLNALLTTAVYSVNTASVATTILNMPAAVPGILEVFRSTNGVIVQRFTGYGSNEALWMRTSINVTAGTLGPWSKIGAAGDGGMDAGPYRRDDLLSRARMRRGGRIGTGGKGAVALRFDHHLVDFQAKVLPLLRQFGLPWAQAINPERLGTGDDLMTYTELQDVCLDSGGEVWNHSGNHADASGDGAIKVQIVDSLLSLKTGLPSLEIEGWCPPGLADGGYAGASPFKTVQQNTETYAGQLSIAHHAFVAGYAPGVYRVLDPSVQAIGAPHITLDQASPSSVTSALSIAVASGIGIALMLHPNYLDQPGYMTTAQFTAILADIAARRDAGNLLALSYSGLWCADSESARRHDLAPLGQVAVSVAAGAAHTVSLPVYRNEHYLGAAREVLVDVDATSATSLTLSVGGRAPTTHAVPSGKSTIRRMVTLPADAAGALSVVATPTAALTVERIRVLAV